MGRRVVEAVASVALGIVALYVGWGRALLLVLPKSQLCLLEGPPRGLHLNDVGMIVYTECQYTYGLAWPVFLLVSLLGIGLVANGLRLYGNSLPRVDVPTFR